MRNESYNQHLTDFILINDLIELIKEYLPNFCKICQLFYSCDKCIDCTDYGDLIKYINVGILNVEIYPNVGRFNPKSIHLQATCEQDIEVFEYWKAFLSHHNYAKYSKCQYGSIIYDYITEYKMSREIYQGKIKQFSAFSCNLTIVKLENDNSIIMTE